MMHKRRIIEIGPFAHYFVEELNLFGLLVVFFNTRGSEVAQ